MRTRQAPAKGHGKMTTEEEVTRHFPLRTANHRLTVLHDDGLYLHLRMSTADSNIDSWQVMTWPGYLAVVGDMCDGFTFHRHGEEDMLMLFHPDRGGINPGYWGEKLATEQRDSWEEFDEDLFRSEVAEAVAESIDDDTLTSAEGAALLEDAETHTDDPVSAVEWAGNNQEFLGDIYEGGFRAPSYNALFTCHALAATAAAYTTYKEKN